MNQENLSKRINQPENVSKEKSNPAFHLFLYLVSFLSLSFLVAGILISIHQAINKFIPDSLDSSYFDNDAIKFGLSALIVTIPLYYGILFLLNRKLERKEIPADSLVRKTITYLALVAFSAMAIGSLVSIMYSYFDGEITTRFVLKALSFLFVSTFFFGFYFWEIRRSEFFKSMFMNFFIASIVIALASMVLGFFVIDNPTTARNKRIDNELIQNMRDAGRKINLEFKGQDEFNQGLSVRQSQRDKMILEMAKNGNTPEEIEKVVNKFYGGDMIGKLPTNQEMNGKIDKNVVYKTKEGSFYELCGDFKIENKTGGNNWNSNGDKWAHPAGNHCFVFDAKDNAYNNYPIQMKVN